MSDIILETRNLTKCFLTENGQELVACNDISLSLERGKALGIVGESGCGKSTFTRMLVNMIAPSSGEILFHGKNITHATGATARDVHKKIQMVFQDPSTAFNPKMRIKDIICEPLLNYNMIKKSQIRETATKFLEMVELPATFMDRYPHNMSGGQRQRIGIARALTLEPEIIICDEATSALDVSVQQSIMKLLTKFQREKNITMVYICHDLALVSQIAHDIAVMYLGNVVEMLPGDHLYCDARHPYTQSLMCSIFDVKMDFNQPIQCLDSDVPTATDAPKGCVFCGRCPRAKARCNAERPILRQIDAAHYGACHSLQEKLH